MCAQDAQILSALLAHPGATRATVRQALRIYSDVRQPVATKFWNAARRNGQLMSDLSIDPHECAAEIFKAGDVWEHSESPEMDRQRALDRFANAVQVI